MDEMVFILTNQNHLTMIRIYRAVKHDVCHFFEQLYQSEEKIWLEPQTLDDTKSIGFPVVWAGAKIVFNHYKQLLDDQQFQNITQKHKIAASIFTSDQNHLSLQELEEKQALCARLESNLTHNFFVQEPFYQVVSNLFSEFMMSQSTRLLIPDITTIDAPTLTVLFQVFKSNSNGYSSVDIGLDPKFDITKESTDFSEIDGEQDHFDESGLLWHYSTFGIKNVIFSFMAMGGKIEENVPHAPQSFIHLSQSTIIDNEQEVLVYKMCLEKGSLDKAKASLAHQVVLNAFHLFDFSIAIGLGKLVIDSPFPFTKTQRAEIHSVLALATHNRQFSSALGNEATNSFIEHHLSRAYEYEQDMTRKAFLQYRMAVLKARRQKDLIGGMEWANLTLNQADDERVPDHFRKYIKAWALNIRAYIHMVSRKLEEAEEDMKEANFLTQQMKEQGYQSRDFAFTVSVMADNMGALTELMGNPYQIKSWLTSSYEASGWHLTNQRFGARIWSEAHLKTLRVDLAIKDTLIGLDASRKDANPFYEDLYLAHLGEFHQRINQTEKALNYFNQSLGIHHQYYSKQRYINVCLLAAKCAISGRFLDEGIRLINLVTQLEEELDQDQQTHLILLKCRLAAEVGDEEAVSSLAQEAINRSVSKGELFDMIYTTSVLGNVCERMGQMQECLEFYEKGMGLIELNDAELKSAAASIACNHQLKYLSITQDNELSKKLLPLMLASMPTALVRSSEAWQHLHILLELFHDADLEVWHTTDTRFLYAILLAGLQRSDCEHWVSSIIKKSGRKTKHDFGKFKKMTQQSLHHVIKNNSAA